MQLLKQYLDFVE